MYKEKDAPLWLIKYLNTHAILVIVLLVNLLHTAANGESVAVTKNRRYFSSFPLSSRPTQPLFPIPPVFTLCPQSRWPIFSFFPSQQGKEDFLQILHRYMEVHGTVYYETQRPPEVPAFVKNHGLLPQNELQQLLRKAKVRLRRKYYLHSARFAVCCPFTFPPEPLLFIC